MFVLALLLVSWPYAEANEYISLAKRLLPAMCPGANVCLGNQTIGNNGNNFIPGETSCCTECSCETDCETTKNCCFPSDVTSKLEVNQPDSVCLFPRIPQPQAEYRVGFNSFKMVSHVPNPNEAINNSKFSCGEEQVAPWGSLLPVFSNKTKTIYKNSACAQAAGVTDGAIWHVEISCKYNIVSREAEDASTLISGLYSGSLPDDCELSFFYPGDSSDLNLQICFEDLISTCPELKFEKPEQFSQLTRKEIRRACRSGLVSPYRMHDMYANVFCHICNGMYFGHTATCKQIQSTRGGRRGRFIALIDGNFMSTFKRKSTKEPYIQQACYKDGEKEPDLCRPVYCPSGQIRDIRGECMFPAKEWYMNICAVNINLTADKFFDISETYGFLNNSEHPLEHKWPKTWLIFTVSYELVNKHDNKHNTLLVQMVNISPITDPEELLKNIQIFLKLPWTLQMNNGALISMSADWVYIPKEFHVALSAPDVALESEDAKVTLPKYVYMYVDKHYIQYSPFLITPLYFCEQIELNILEFELYAQNTVLWNKITNQTFYIGEFATVPSVSYPADKHARICLMDSGFTKLEQLSLSGSAGCVAVSRILVSAWMCTFLLGHI